MNTDQPSGFRIGKWFVEPSLGKLTANGQTVSIRPREMDLLVYLAKQEGGIVTADEIITHVWAGVAVTNDSLYFSMSQLRKALDDEGAEKSAIETLPKRGYRLVEPVEFSAAVLPGETTTHDAPPDTIEVPAANPGPRRQAILYGASVVAVVLLLAAAITWFRSMPPTIEEPVADPGFNSIAVMPFIDLTPETDYTYFSDGITEEILNRLTRVQGLRVAARTSSFSFKDNELDVVEIGRALGVSSILEGSVRKEGERVRISAQLVDATTGFQLWSNSYERELSSVFAIQNEISRRIIDALQLTLTASLPENADREVSPTNPLALDEYLRGLEAHRTYSFDSLRRAQNHFETVLEIDPAFALARVQLADTIFSILHTGASYDEALVEEAESLVRDAISADQDNGAAHRVLAQVHRWRGEWAEFESELNKAIALAPSDSLALVYLSHLSMHRGDVGEALEILDRALRIDPFGATVLQNLGRAQQQVGQFAQARQTFSRAIDLHPENPNHQWMLGKLQVDHLGEISGGLESLLNSAAIDRDDYEIAAYVAMTYLTLEMPEAAEPWIQRAMRDGPGTVTSRALETVGLLLRGEDGNATNLAIETLQSQPSRFSAHGMLSESLIYVAVNQMVAAGKADDAVDLLETEGLKFRESPRMTLDPQVQDAVLVYHDIPRRWSVALASAYLASGRQEKASEIIERPTFARLESIVEYRENALNRDYLIEAEVRMIEGNTSGALDMLEAAVDANLFFNWQIRVERNNAFSGIKSDPRYVAVLDRIKEKIRIERLSITDSRQASVQSGTRLPGSG
jgi:TolB-like protein/DNA-binding winged helix-turn-helix (wHTH) protein/lipopolysaccharide biosynthesis regulator YciM